MKELLCPCGCSARASSSASADRRGPARRGSSRWSTRRTEHGPAALRSRDQGGRDAGVRRTCSTSSSRSTASRCSPRRAASSRGSCPSLAVVGGLGLLFVVGRRFVARGKDRGRDGGRPPRRRTARPTTKLRRQARRRARGDGLTMPIASTDNGARVEPCARPRTRGHPTDSGARSPIAPPSWLGAARRLAACS